MILCENLTPEDLRRIGGQIGEAFLGEEGAFRVLTPDQAGRLFTLIAETCYRTGHLYTTGENQEGFCVYWTKKQRPGAWIQLKMGLEMGRILGLKTGLLLSKSQKNWKPTEKRYAKAPDYVEVFLLAVRREYQGQGHFRRMLEEVFDLARQRGTLCVLDTDSGTKAEKYTHVGMRVAESRPQPTGITMYALEK